MAQWVAGLGSPLPKASRPSPIPEGLEGGSPRTTLDSSADCSSCGEPEGEADAAWLHVLGPGVPAGPARRPAAAPIAVAAAAAAALEVPLAPTPPPPAAGPFQLAASEWHPGPALAPPEPLAADLLGMVGAAQRARRAASGPLPPVAHLKPKPMHVWEGMQRCSAELPRQRYTWA